ncbi:Condensin-2 complex subunit H2 [Gonapodya sp. JEL0774]|nr:Condensin-2 complex subunit H2 [Gonapodya sp. JEL0774]
MPSQKPQTGGIKRIAHDSDEPSAEGLRVAKLTKPIRDFAESWKIDITKELDEYLEDIAEALVVDVAQLDFRKAGILVQATSSIYSKKVESLAKFFHQFFTDVTNQKEKRKIPPKLGDAGRDEDGEMEWKALDDIEVCTSLDYDDDDAHERALIRDALPLPQVPAALLVKMDLREGWMTRDLFSRNGEAIGKIRDMMINATSVHSSGTLLIDQIGELLLERKTNSVLPEIFKEPPIPDLMDLEEGEDRLQFSAATVEGGVGVSDAVIEKADDVFFAANLSAAGEDTQDVGPDLHEHMEVTVEDHMDIREGLDADVPTLDEGLALPDYVDAGDDTDLPLSEFQGEEEDLPDPWGMELDPHQSGVLKSKAPRKGKVRPARRNKRETATAVPPLQANGNVRQFLKNINAQQASKRSIPHGPMKGLYWEGPSLTLIFVSILPSSPEIFAEFGYAYANELNRRKDRLRQFTASFAIADTGGAAMTAQSGDRHEASDLPWQMNPPSDDDYDLETVAAGVFHAPEVDDANNAPDVDFLQDGPWVPDDTPALGSAANRNLADAISAGALAGPLTSSYEDLCKKYVDDYLRKAQQFSEDRENGIAKRVRSWEDKMKPILETQEFRGSCDIMDYGTKVVNGLAQNRSKPGAIQSFGTVAIHHESYEICRLFLAMLHLANAGNLEILGKGSFDTDNNLEVGDVKLRLISSKIGDLE